MNYTKDKLLKVARHWEGLSFNEQLADKSPTPMITIEVLVAVWDKIWEDDPAPMMYEALKEISQYDKIEFMKASWLEALAKAEGGKL